MLDEIIGVNGLQLEASVRRARSRRYSQRLRDRPLLDSVLGRRRAGGVDGGVDKGVADTASAKWPVGRRAVWAEIRNL